ncbi:MAG TPA: aminotransferase class III-fold pyridoxal phosphate-dependent enzyme [Dehalococcoidia bacterium]|nr:aminotransferase class III-fold pyridoxal phosphate-dependent enzyme [Dehalococcoidia bacterium]
MNYAEIQERLQRLAARPARDIADERMSQVREEFRRKTAKSGALFERAKNVVSQGVEHVLSPTDPYPLFMELGEGSRLTDVDGNVYVDHVLGGGTIILGHNPPRLNERIADVLRRKGPLHGLCDEYEVLAAERIARYMPAVEKVRFFQSGTEADMAAARLVRAYTGKKKIIKFRGAYHGWSDQFLTDMWVPGSGPLLANGIPPEHRAHTVLVYQNDLDELEQAFEDHRDDVAAVFVEPVGAESGSLPLMDGFHQEVRRLCDRHGALYVFDEVVTGFRLGLGGAQAYFGVEPDVTVLGKIIMGGYPSCGAVAGRGEIMDTFSGATGVGGRTAFVAGTLAANVLSTAACYFTMVELEETGAIEKAAQIADEQVAGLNTMFAARGTDYFAYNYGSILHVETAAPAAFRVDAPGGLQEVMRRKDCLEKYALILRNEGILTILGRGFVSAAHSHEDIAGTVAAYAKVIDMLD